MKITKISKTTNAVGQVINLGDDFLRPGFPGQAQVLTDLYYNRARDYDPVLGRYIQADPIGLMGGANPYLYAGADPVNMVDPLGLDAFLNGHNPAEEIIYQGTQMDIDRRSSVSNDPKRGLLHIYGHGNSNRMCVYGFGCMDPNQFAEWLEKRPEYWNGRVIRLWGCNTGYSDFGFAQQLSNRLNTAVIAPQGYTRWNHRGYIGTFRKRGGIGWLENSQTFFPQYKISH